MASAGSCSRLSVRLFGVLELSCGAERLRDFPTRKARYLFCYLVLHSGRVHARDVLMGLFWGDVPEDSARKHLRMELWRVRSYLAEAGVRLPWVTTRSGGIGLDASPDLWVDVVAFEQALARAGTSNAANALAVTVLEDAIELYRADLLEDVYDDWCASDRDRLRLLYAAALGRLMHVHMERRDYDRAELIGRRLLASNPLLEHVHRDLMRCFYYSGDRAAAAHQFESCVGRLRAELGLAPMQETVTLWRAICAGRLPDAQLEPAPAFDASHTSPRMAAAERHLQRARRLLHRELHTHG